MRILSLELQTVNLPELANFYAGRLGLPVKDRSAEHVRMQIGHSELIFRQPAGLAGPPPVYHFAFNVPSDSIRAATAWLRARAPLIQLEGRDIVDFPNWAAHSVYARDPAGNIIECIARHELPLPSAGTVFDAGDLYGISEAGLVVADVPAYAEELSSRHGLPYYHRQPPAPRFTALGDDEGLLILVPADRPWFPTTDVLSQAFPMTLTLERNAQAQRIELRLP